MHREIIKGEWVNELVFAILDREWKERLRRSDDS